MNHGSKNIVYLFKKIVVQCCIENTGTYFTNKTKRYIFFFKETQF